MKVAVIGTGTMGLGITQVFAQFGYSVTLCSREIKKATVGKNIISSKLNKLVDKGKIEQSKLAQIQNNISTGIYNDAYDSDLIIEAVSENLDIKRELLEELDKVCKKNAIYASNTSSLSITELSNYTSHELIGMHFFNPAHVMALVEIIPGLKTTDVAVNKVIEIVKSIEKEPVVVKESPGFIVNRLLLPMINEAIGLYADGIAKCEDIDKAMKLGTNHPIGPLELADLIGLDVCLSIMEVIYNETCDSKYRPHPLLRKMVRGGYWGRKVSKGFYSYFEQ